MRQIHQTTFTLTVFSVTPMEEEGAVSFDLDDLGSLMDQGLAVADMVKGATTVLEGATAITNALVARGFNPDVLDGEEPDASVLIDGYVVLTADGTVVKWGRSVAGAISDGGDKQLRVRPASALLLDQLDAQARGDVAGVAYEQVELGNGDLVVVTDDEAEEFA